MLAHQTEGFAPRPYQVKTLEALRENLRRGIRRQIICAPTGSGKTVIAGTLIKEAVAKGSRVLFIADRKALVNQTSKRFYEMGIEHGRIQAQNTHNTDAQVLVASAQTLERWPSMPDTDIIIIDEAHSVRQSAKDWLATLDMPVVGLTATPFTKGLGQIYSAVVNTCTTDNLLEWRDPNTQTSYLAPLRVFVGSEINMKGAAVKSDGEWQDREIESRGQAIIGDAVIEWTRKTRQLFGGPVKTLVRSATIKHGAEIVQAFQSAGYDFKQATHTMSDSAEAALLEDFRRGTLTGLVSVDKFNKGFDVPDILCLIDQRPLRKSLASEIQFLGRGMRSAPGKEYVLVLDHTSNYLSFARGIHKFFADGVRTLADGEKRLNVVRKELSPVQRLKRLCSCGFVIPPGADYCPSCGAAAKKRRARRRIVRKAGRLEQYASPGSNKKSGWAWDQAWTWREMCTVALDLKSGDWDGATRLAKAQFKQFYGMWPDMEFTPEEGERGDNRVRDKMLEQLSAYTRSKRVENDAYR